MSIVVNDRVKKYFKIGSSNWKQTACGMMIIELGYHKTASMYVYELQADKCFHLIHTMDAKYTTVMPDSFDKNAKPFTLNHLADGLIKSNY